MLNPEALLYNLSLLHRPVPVAAELRGITIKITLNKINNLLERLRETTSYHKISVFFYMEGQNRIIRIESIVNIYGFFIEILYMLLEYRIFFTFCSIKYSIYTDFIQDII